MIKESLRNNDGGGEIELREADLFAEGLEFGNGIHATSTTFCVSPSVVNCAAGLSARFLILMSDDRERFVLIPFHISIRA